MTSYKKKLNRFRLLFLASACLATTLYGCAISGLGFDTRWQEEVQLHDGRTLILLRSVNHGGRSEVGQGSPVREHTLRFQLPGNTKWFTWTSEYGEDLGRTNFNVLALHVLGDTPYVVTEPNLCLSYNKWGRPNPPYVIFKWAGDRWVRIPISELPLEFKTMNVVISASLQNISSSTAGIGYLPEGLTPQGIGYVPKEAVQKLNRNLLQREYKNILREPYEGASGVCGEMIQTGDGGWSGISWFKDQPSLSACLTYCESKRVRKIECPCNKLWEGK